LNPAKFGTLALYVMLFVSFFTFLKIYLQNVISKMTNDDERWWWLYNHNQHGSFITTCYHWYGNKANLNLIIVATFMFVHSLKKIYVKLETHKNSLW